jgi:hypothetical protein
MLPIADLMMKLQYPSTQLSLSRLMRKEPLPLTVFDLMAFALSKCMVLTESGFKLITLIVTESLVLNVA